MHPEIQGFNDFSGRISSFRSFFSIIGGVSDDGSVIVGSSVHTLWDEFDNVLERTDWEVFTWTESTGMVGTGIQLTSNYPLAITNDGSMISGTTNGSPEEYPEAFYWTEETGVVDWDGYPGPRVKMERRTLKFAT